MVEVGIAWVLPGSALAGSGSLVFLFAKKNMAVLFSDAVGLVRSVRADGGDLRNGGCLGVIVRHTKRRMIGSYRETHEAADDRELS